MYNKSIITHSILSVHHACGRQKKRDTDSGFTLIELMVVIAIIGVISVCGLGTVSYLSHYDIGAAAYDIASAFDLARLRAIHDNDQYTVTFNQSISGVNYLYVVFRDTQIPVDQKYDAGETIITRVRANEYKNVSMTPHNTFTAVNSQGLTCIAFRPNGFIATLDGSPVRLDFTVANEIKGRSVFLSMSGCAYVRMLDSDTGSTYIE